MVKQWCWGMWLEVMSKKAWLELRKLEGDEKGEGARKREVVGMAGGCGSDRSSSRLRRKAQATVFKAGGRELEERERNREEEREVRRREKKLKEIDERKVHRSLSPLLQTWSGYQKHCLVLLAVARSTVRGLPTAEAIENTASLTKKFGESSGKLIQATEIDVSSFDLNQGFQIMGLI